MARADKKLAEERIAAIKAQFQSPDVHRFLHRQPIFRVEHELPETMQDELRRLEEAEKQGGGRDRGGSGR